MPIYNIPTHPEMYTEESIGSGGVDIVLSMWQADVASVATIVFLPGTMCHPLYYERFLDRLAAQSMSVVGVHFVGHGKSPRRSVFDFDDLIDNACDAARFARDRFGGPVVLIGSSQGSAVALAALHRGVADAAICHDLLVPGRPETIGVTRFPRWLGRFTPLLAAALRFLSRLAPRIAVPAGAYLDLRRVFADESSHRAFSEDPLGRTAYPLRFMASLLSVDIPLSGYDRPIVVITADRDPLVPIDYQRNLFDELDAPGKRFVEIPSTRHLLLVESPEMVVGPVVSAIRTVLQGV